MAIFLKISIYIQIVIRLASIHWLLICIIDLPTSDIPSWWKISPGWWGWGVHGTPTSSLYLPSHTKLQSMVQLRGQVHSTYCISTLYLLSGGDRGDIQEWGGLGGRVPCVAEGGWRKAWSIYLTTALVHRCWRRSIARPKIIAECTQENGHLQSTILSGLCGIPSTVPHISQLIHV